jgi:hypothetical protein
VKAIRIKEAHIKILNLNLNTLDSRKQSQSIDITSTRLRGMYGFDKDYNKVEEIENSDEDNLEMDNEIASNVHRSIHLNSKQSSGTQVTRIKSNHIQIQSSDDEAPMPTNHESNVYQSKGSSSFKKKSRVSKTLSYLENSSNLKYIFYFFLNQVYSRFTQRRL